MSIIEDIPKKTNIVISRTTQKFNKEYRLLADVEKAKVYLYYLKRERTIQVYRSIEHLFSANHEAVNEDYINSDLNNYKKMYSDSPQLDNLEELEIYIANSLNEESITEENFRDIANLRKELISSLEESFNNQEINNELLEQAKNNTKIKTRMGKIIERINITEDNPVKINKDEIITVSYKGTNYVITATETKPNSTLFNYIIYSKEKNTLKTFRNEAIFIEHNYNNSKFAQYTKSLLYGEEEIKSTNFGKALKNLNNQYEKQLRIRTQTVEEEIENIDYDIIQNIEEQIQEQGFINYIDSNLKKIYLGDTKNLIKGLLCSINIVLSIESYFLEIEGHSELGKSFLSKLILMMLPKEDIVRYNVISDAALYKKARSKPKIYNNKIIYMGDLGSSKQQEKTKELRDTLKVLITEGYANKTICGTKDEIIEMNLECESVGLMYECINSLNTEDDQLESRTITITAPNVKDKDICFLGAQQTNKNTKISKRTIKAKEQLSNLRHYIRYLKEENINVEVNHFWEDIYNYVQYNEKVRRTFNRYIKLFKIYCILNKYDSIKYNDTLIASNKQLQGFLNEICTDVTLTPINKKFITMLREQGNKIEIVKNPMNLIINYANNNHTLDHYDMDNNNSNSIELELLEDKEVHNLISKVLKEYPKYFFTVKTLKRTYRNNKGYKDILDISKTLEYLYDLGYIEKLDYQRKIGKIYENVYYLTEKVNNIDINTINDYTDNEVINKYIKLLNT